MSSKHNSNIGMVNTRRRSLLATGFRFSLAAALIEADVVQAASCVDPDELSGADLSIRKSAEYVDVFPDETKSCRRCEFFTAGENSCGRCRALSGPVNASGHCTSWSASANGA